MVKHVLFYSNFCNHCQDLLTDIIKKGLRKQFVLICVEKHKDKLPSFVNRVPFIVNANGMHILEHNIGHFLEGMCEKDEYDDITAFVSCPRGHFGNEFCYVDDVPPKNDISATLGYVFIDEDDKYQGSEEDTSISRKNAMTEQMKQSVNDAIINPKQMLQRDLFDESSLPMNRIGIQQSQTTPLNQTRPSYSPQFNAPSIPSVPYSNSHAQFSSPSSGPSKLPLHLQAQDPRLASLPPQYQQQGTGQTLSYNPSIDIGGSEPTLPFQQIKIEKPKKIGDNLVDNLVQQRMNDLKAYM